MSFVWQQLLDSPKQYYRLDEVALAFGASKRSVQRWMENGKIPYIETPGKHRRIPRQFLVAASPTFLTPI